MRNLLKFSFMLFALGTLRAQTPSVTILPLSFPYCTGFPLTFSAVASQSDAVFTWSLASSKGVSNITSLNAPDITITFTAAITYSLFVTASNANGVSTTSTSIQINRLPKASFYAEMDAAGFPVKLTLTNYSSNNVINYWTYNDVATVDSSINAARFYTAPGNYSVTLTAKGQRGCSTISSYSFEIPRFSSLTLPNVFTPNGDGVNDVYKPIATGISVMKGRVYSRYGLLVYAWDKVNDWWDGYTTSGLPCADGQYFVWVEATGFDGQYYKLKTAVTLAR